MSSAMGGETMRHHDACDVTVANTPDNLGFGLGVERARGLVQDDDGGVDHQRTRNLHALQLTT
jgi:hypothetical protein